MVNRPLRGARQTRAMDLAQVARMIAALAVTLGLIGLAFAAARRFAPLAVLRLKTPSERRLKVVESLMLDPHRRLVVVRFDDEERLLLLGEGRVLASVPARRETQAGPPPVLETFE